MELQDGLKMGGAIIVALGGKSIFNMFKRWMDSHDKTKENSQNDGIAFRKNLVKRVEDLEKESKADRIRIEELIEENTNLRVELGQANNLIELLKQKKNNEEN